MEQNTVAVVVRYGKDNKAFVVNIETDDQLTSLCIKRGNGLIEFRCATKAECEQVTEILSVDNIAFAQKIEWVEQNNVEQEGIL